MSFMQTFQSWSWFIHYSNNLFIHNHHPFIRIAYNHISFKWQFIMCRRQYSIRSSTHDKLMFEKKYYFTYMHIINLPILCSITSVGCKIINYRSATWIRGFERRIYHGTNLTRPIIDYRFKVRSKLAGVCHVCFSRWCLHSTHDKLQLV